MYISIEDGRLLDEHLAALAPEEVSGFGMQVSKNRWLIAGKDSVVPG